MGRVYGNVGGWWKIVWVVIGYDVVIVVGLDVGVRGMEEGWRRDYVLRLFLNLFVR